MYKAFYGLSEAPFSIAPNPKYLFLSDRHKEALAHLRYGLGEGGGFVLLTGEVGTGKTTVARSVLNQLPDTIDVASILNPSLTEQELLATLCDELGITYPDNPSLKQLTDQISAYLLANHENGRQTLLIIDEAQHLRGEVLEQLRLLTNLETDQQKLLQVILIGQPELQQMLKQQHLRQLAQRITARYHLMPLNAEEISSYVVHRLQVAGREAALFSKAACDRIHQLGQGIPRVTNLLCERALITAYGQQLTQIGPRIIDQAASDVLVVDVPPQKNAPAWRVPALVSVLTTGLGFSAAYLLFNEPATQDGAIEPPQTLVQGDNHSGINTGKGPVERNVATDPQSGLDLTPYIHQSLLRQPAFSALMGLWGTSEGAGTNPCYSAQRFGLRCFEGLGWAQLQQYQYPAVVELQERGQVFYAVVVATSSPSQPQQQVTLQLGRQQLLAPLSWLLERWSGQFTLLWQPLAGFENKLGLWDRGPAVTGLNHLISTIYNAPQRQVVQFDRQLEQQVRRFQQEQQLTVDGIVGSNTLLQLQAMAGLSGPRLERPANAILPESDPGELVLLDEVTLPPAPARQLVADPVRQSTLMPLAASARVGRDPKTDQLLVDHRRGATEVTVAGEQRQVEQLVANGEVPADLAARFNAALSATEDYENSINEPLQATALHALPLAQHPDWYQQLVPTLSFSSHIYSSDEENRFVKVNGQVVREGELIDSNLRLISIEPQQVVIEMQERQFTLSALTDW